MNDLAITPQLSPLDERIVILIVSGMSATKAAAELGVSSQTVYRHIRRPLVRTAISELRAGEFNDAAALGRREVRRSMETLIALRDDDDGHPSTRLRAAEAVIKLTTDLHKLTDHEPRIAAIEAKFDEQEASDTPNQDE